MRIIAGDHVGKEANVAYMVLTDPTNPKVCVVTDDKTCATIVINFTSVVRCHESTA